MVDPFIYIEKYLRDASRYFADSERFYFIAADVFAVLVTIAIPVSLALIIGIVYSVERLKAIRSKEEQIYDAVAIPTNDDKTPSEKKQNERWAKVLTHVESANANDWMLAIIEADIILGEILDKQGYQGDSIGEKLKRVEKADFNTLDQAWEAHKVRNAIAHQGSNFVITQREAKRIIGLYRQIFEEFYYI